MMNSKNRLIFDHIPKTAGQSISDVLSQIFGENGSLPQISNSHRHSVLSAAGKRFIAGHLYFLPGEQLITTWFYCTILREPVDRFLSQYWFNKSDQWLSPNTFNDIRLKDPQVLAARNLSLDEYLKLDISSVIRSYTNVQAVHFAQRKCPSPYDLSDSELFEAAVESLEEYDLVGIFEDIPGFIDTISSIFGHGSTIKVPYLNITNNCQYKNNIDVHLIEKLCEVNQADKRLYELAKKRFLQKKQDMLHVKTEHVSVSDDNLMQQSDFNMLSSPKEENDRTEFGTHEIEVLSIKVLGTESGVSVVNTGENIIAYIECLAKTIEPDLTIGIAVRDRTGQLIYGTNSQLLGVNVSISRLGRINFQFSLHGRLGIGEYAITIALHQGRSHLEGRCYHWIDNAVRFTVVGHKESVFEGIVDLSGCLNVERDV